MRTLLFLAALLCAPVAQAQTVNNLAWLKGCWRTEAPHEAESGAQTTEVWVDPPGPAMFGYSFTEGEGEVQGWEQMRIDAGDGGRPRLVAMPNGGAPVVFEMVEPDTPAPNVVVFERADHDYPQMIEYRRVGRALTATIARIDGTHAYTYSYRRIGCPASVRP